MDIAIDIGNTLIKIGVFESSTLKESHIVLREQDVLSFLEDKNPQRIILSDVKKTSLSEKLSDQNLVTLTKNTALPIQIDYKTPETLGVDRLAIAAGAYHHFPDKSSLCISLGSCITYDFIDYSGCFQGGNISPGYAMRLQAMNQFTAALPPVNPKKGLSSSWIGKSTEDALLNGAFWGVVDEINGFITRYAENYPNLNIVLCGGDAKTFESRIKAPIFVAPEMALIGLYAILEYNT